jgi:hypothetical protein
VHFHQKFFIKKKGRARNNKAEEGKLHEKENWNTLSKSGDFLAFISQDMAILFHIFSPKSPLLDLSGFFFFFFLATCEISL